MICTFCLRAIFEGHEERCPISINKKALEMWRKGLDNAKTGGPMPGDPILAEVINLYQTYLLGYERGKQMQSESV